MLGGTEEPMQAKGYRMWFPPMVLQVSMLDLIATPQKASLLTERTTNDE